MRYLKTLVAFFLGFMIMALTVKGPLFHLDQNKAYATASVTATLTPTATPTVTLYAAKDCLSGDGQRKTWCPPATQCTTGQVVVAGPGPDPGSNDIGAGTCLTIPTPSAGATPIPPIVPHTLTGATPVPVSQSTVVPNIDTEYLQMTTNVTAAIPLPCYGAAAHGAKMQFFIINGTGAAYTLTSGTVGPLTVSACSSTTLGAASTVGSCVIGATSGALGTSSELHISANYQVIGSAGEWTVEACNNVR